jgi:ABC-2 type transport system ATP-binding protein
MDEASLCDRVALIQNGKILSVDTPKGIVNSFPSELISVKSANMLKLLNEVKNIDGVADAYPFGEYHHVVLKKNFSRQNLQDYLLTGYDDRVEIREVEPDIEDCFIALMKDSHE